MPNVRASSGMIGTIRLPNDLCGESDRGGCYPARRLLSLPLRRYREATAWLRKILSVQRWHFQLLSTRLSRRNEASQRRASLRQILPFQDYRVLACRYGSLPMSASLTGILKRVRNAFRLVFTQSSSDCEQRSCLRPLLPDRNPSRSWPE
jgi:hypothetical protein